MFSPQSAKGACRASKASRMLYGGGAPRSAIWGLLLMLFPVLPTLLLLLPCR